MKAISRGRSSAMRRCDQDDVRGVIVYSRRQKPLCWEAALEGKKETKKAETGECEAPMLRKEEGTLKGGRTWEKVRDGLDYAIGER